MQSDIDSVIATPGKAKSKKGWIIGIIAVVVLLAGVGVGIYLVQQNQEIRRQAKEYTVCSPDACASCILNARPDILPFYDSNGWSTACNNQLKIINNWCGPTVDPDGCLKEKAENCPTECGVASSATSTPTATPTQAPTSAPTGNPTSQPTNQPTSTPQVQLPAKTATPIPTATNRVSIPTTEQGIPKTGTGLPAILGAGAGILLLLGAFVLAL